MNNKPKDEKTGQGRKDGPSLEPLADNTSNKGLKPLAKEYAQGAMTSTHLAGPPRDFSRRELMKLMAASFALAGSAGCRRPVETIVPYVDPPERAVPGIPRYYATTMPLALSAYGLVVESHEGRPIKIEGNPRHSSTLGASNSMMQAAILGLYDPDRSQSVLHEGEETTWDDFVTAWEELGQTGLENEGVGLAVLSESFSSPTLARLKEAFLHRFPQASWVTYEPMSNENVFQGIASATGKAYQPAYHFDRAKVILALDADFLAADTENVAHARGFASGRSLTPETDSMNRLYVVESNYTLTGANADHRLRRQSRHIGRFVVALVEELRRQGLAISVPISTETALPEVDAKWIEVVAGDLLSNRGQGILIAGNQQPPPVHAALFALNDALGNVGSTLTVYESQDNSPSRLEDLLQLSAAMESGAVSTLIILGGNPVYDAPVDLNFGKRLSKVQTVIHLSPYLDETSQLAHWHIPKTHFLETWGDARAVGGPASVVQPLILPLFGAHSAEEVLAVLSGQEVIAAYDQVRATWRELLGEENFEKAWNRVLHDGVLEGSDLPPVTPELRQTALAEAVAELALPADEAGSGDALGSGNLEIVFHASPAVFDGRFANNSWLQELPDAISKLTWDNAALLSPKTAEALGLGNEDMARLSLGDRAVDVPVWIVPGHADDSVSVTLGYGRRSAGRVGNGVGSDLYALRTSMAPGFDGALRLEKTGRTYPLSTTQDQPTMAGRPLVREASLRHYQAHPDFAAHHEEHDARGAALFNDPFDWGQGYQWGMTIDLTTCIGCNACMVACQSENNVSVVGKAQVKKGREMHWLRVDRYFTSPAAGENGGGLHEEGPYLLPGEPTSEEPRVVFQPMPCQHCETAPCEQVCPVAATVHDSEGLNVMVYNRCIGTRYCSNNCPYKVRRFNYFNLTKHLPEIMKLAQNPDVTVRSRGVIEKCSFCLQRISAAKIQAKRERRGVRDGEVQTACQQACPVSAIQFGNVNDPASAVARNKRSDRNYVVLGEVNTRPRVSYLAKVRNPHPELVGDAGAEVSG